MKVVEIFESIQGEGAWMGVYCTFIRLAGCNLNCSFCDERKKYDRATEMSLGDIVNSCHTYHVVITGGEPTINPEFDELVQKLEENEHFVHVETNGTGPVRIVADWVTVSPKGPHYTFNTYANEVKLVVDEALTWDDVEKIHGNDNSAGYIWLQPCDGPSIDVSKKKILQWLERFPSIVRAGIQLHKWYAVE